jgi:anti-anti-sigma factor
MDLGIATVDDTDPAVVTLTGELDLASADKLADRIRGLVDTGHPRLIVDLAGLIFCDSTGMGTLVRANNECLAQGGYLRLAAPNHNVARVLAVVGLLDAFPVYQSVDAARMADADGLVVVGP